jgi:hypothetical protein
MAGPKGWHSRGYLPHFDSPETIQFVTFRLADSLPRQAIERIRMQEHVLQHLDHELDAGLGACWLRRSEIASLVENALFHFDGQRYHLLAWRIVPNHVHIVIEIIGDHSLSKIAWSWKSFTAKAGKCGPATFGGFLGCRLFRPVHEKRRTSLPNHRIR